ncbi:MAG: hypothetical protein QMD85_02545 [Candidatus Aenigmarchaeota archaeon]|nr:hypothetical protein [Candidatus Aenigmarchaeota archaeon]
MQKEVISQKQFLEMLSNGIKEFSNATMQFFDLHHLKLENVVFENCSLMFCTFSSCEFRNVKFVKCEMYFGSFYTGIADRLVFDKCGIDMTLFDSFQFSSSRMQACTLRWSGILNSNVPGIDISTSTRIKFVTSVSEITSSFVEDSVHEIMKNIERLDVGMRMKIKEMIRQDMNRYNLEHPEEKQEGYGKSNGYADAPLAYGEMRHAVESFFYGIQQIYKTKKAYETESKYNSKEH